MKKLTILFIIFILTGCSQNIENPKQTSLQNEKINSWQEYKNEKYQISFNVPLDWTGYFVEEEQDNYIRFHVPTNDKNWNDAEEIIDWKPVYPTIFILRVMPISKFKELEQLYKEWTPSDSCPKESINDLEENILGKNDKYVVDWCNYKNTPKPLDFKDKTIITKEYAKDNFRFIK